jgi:hypothetical protein
MDHLLVAPFLLRSHVHRPVHAYRHLFPERCVHHQGGGAPSHPFIAKLRRGDVILREVFVLRPYHGTHYTGCREWFWMHR